MNSANSRLVARKQWALPLMALALLLLPVSTGQATQAAPSAEPAPPPLAAAPAVTVEPEEAVATQAKTDTPEAKEEAKEEADVAALEESEAPDPQKVLEMLRSGNGGQPLTVAQLATVNDMLKRMEFLAQVENKMRDITNGLSTGSVGTAPISMGSNPVSGGPRPPGGGPGAASSGGGNLTVVRIVGVSGRYSATLSTGTGQMTVREGDNTDLGRISRIGVNGVTVAGSNGPVTLPFSSTSAFAGVSFNR